MAPLDAAEATALKCNKTIPNLFPNSTDLPHDATRNSFFIFASKDARRVGSDFSLHPCVLKRYKTAPVFRYEELKDHRP